MLKIFSIIILFLFTFSIFLENTFAVTKKNYNYFIITAYYSPLPNQSHYIMWNYEKEIRMNGRWIRWASWKKVFSWMLAAPKKYSFWTKIKIKWLWIWEVTDRWWAIVQAWERNFKYDRIDIWVWHWEEGLKRAMYWGNRTVQWEVIKKSNKNTLNINKIPSPKWTIFNAKKNPNYNKAVLKKWTVQNKIYLSWNNEWTNNNSPIIPFYKGDEQNIFSWPIKNSTWVKILQKLLIEMKLYSWKTNWEYSSIRKIILDFQLKNKVISKKTDIWAWNFWPKTRKTLKQKYNLFLENKKIAEKKAKLEKEKNILLEKQRKINLEKAKEKIKNLWDIKFWDISHEVRELQIILKKLWFLNNKDTAIFWQKTKEALINYQIAKKLIINKNSIWTGIFWPNTKKSLIKDLSEIK